MGRIARVATIAAAVMLSGCGPSYSPQELAAVSNARQVNEELAREHKITWAEAARRNAATAREVGGSRVTQGDELAFSLRTALAAEVDAGRMTPEMADLRFQEHLAEERAQQEVRDAQQRQAFADAMVVAGQSMQNAAQQNRPINCTSMKMGTMVNTTCN